ncbi:kynurenine 3-monooxygenase [Aulographum hederae CBS 113979]|uniref:Kynurenine 3-monooxygenase n=1 Tax=Aulographum hederae CBS 113979 TaxID=1176131 RepID=A0A6G1HAP6_9PEZI|nr:kynurenine 3-monooxygenase [Aulographum hederae CBS 113979]
MAAVTRQKIIVVGAGPVGALAALYAAKRGDDVEVYELRGDLRDASTIPLNFTKSINLALSERGINSMKMAQCEGLLEAVLNETIPMHGRMIHGENNGKVSEESQAYDVHGRFIRAVDRHGLNNRMLDELEKMPNVQFFFNHKLTGADFKQNLAWFERREAAGSASKQDGSKPHSEEIQVPFDFMIGADGAHSSVRYNLMKYARMNYQQEYIDTLWCEFLIEPQKTAQGSQHAISPNHLHIWPGGSFMFIAIPSLDKSFTCTLFLPALKFEWLDAHPESLIPFFRENFPGVVSDLIPEEEIKRQYNSNPHLPLISIKCTPYHHGSSVVILGDAAHAMVPFYGQGMNAGLEDVRVLFDHLDAHTASVVSSNSARAEARAAALETYTAQRHPDAVSINDLALRNYKEMNHDVTSPIYMLRKRIEESLNTYFPKSGWATQYSRVSFGNERYSDVQKSAQRQGRILTRVMGALPVVMAGVGWAAWWAWRVNRAVGEVAPGRSLSWLGTRIEELGKSIK